MVDSRFEVKAMQLGRFEARDACEISSGSSSETKPTTGAPGYRKWQAQVKSF